MTRSNYPITTTPLSVLLLYVLLYDIGCKVIVSRGPRHRLFTRYNTEAISTYQVTSKFLLCCCLLFLGARNQRFMDTVMVMQAASLIVESGEIKNTCS